jgi:hypothetical protein
VTERLAAIKAASKFFSEDKDRSFESKVSALQDWQVLIWSS